MKEGKRNKHLILGTFSEDAFFKANKIIARHFKNNNTAIILARLISKFKYFEKHGMLTNDDCFYATKSTLQEECNVGIKELNKSIGNLIKSGIISKEVMGLPAKTYYMINFDIMADFMVENATQPNNGDSLLPGSLTRRLPKALTSILPGALTNKEEVSKKKNIKKTEIASLTNDTPNLTTSHHSLFKNLPHKSRSKKHVYLSPEDLSEGILNIGGTYTVNYTNLLLGEVSTSTDVVTSDFLDRIDNVRLNKDNAAHQLFDALTIPLKLDTEWVTTDRDTQLISSLCDYDSLTSDEILDKLLSNMFLMLSGKKVLRFGNIFVGLEQLNENRANVAS